MNEIIPAGPSGNALVTLAIGQDYLDQWEKYCSASWMKYCEINNLGLFIAIESLDKRQPQKKPQWQKLLLAGALRSHYPEVKNFCYLDSDILINYHQPSIFDDCDLNKLNLVSQVHNLPFSLNYAQKSVSFYRNKFYSKKYPLNSSILFSVEDIYSYHNLPKFNDYFCSGFFAGSVEQFASPLNQIYDSYDHTVESLTDGGDEPLLNFEFQSRFQINWLPYKYQALWLFEMASYYPFLYDPQIFNTDLLSACISAVLSRNVFLHFAGSWGESSMIQFDGRGNFGTTFSDFQAYLKEIVAPTAYGKLKLDN